MTLERFQSVVAGLDKLEQEGRIQLLEKHQESQSANHLVDLVRYKRLR
jgi:hypothetical protein